MLLPALSSHVFISHPRKSGRHGNAQSRNHGDGDEDGGGGDVDCHGNTRRVVGGGTGEGAAGRVNF